MKLGGNGEKQPKPLQNSTDIFQLSTGWMKEHSQKTAGSSNARVQSVAHCVSTAEMVQKKISVKRSLL